MDIRQLDRKHVWHPFQSQDDLDQQLILASGHGPFVVDSDGIQYLDAISGLWNVNLGYSEHRLVDAISAQLHQLPFTPLAVHSHQPAIRLAEALCMKAPGDIDFAFFTSGGAESVETAIKLARQYFIAQGSPEKVNLIALRQAYHGLSLGALSLTGITEDRVRFGPLPPNTIHVASPYTIRLQSDEVPDTASIVAGCMESFMDAIRFHDPTTIAAVIVEPVMGVAGMIPVPDEYLRLVRQVCDSNDILLIFDEVVTGLGRLGAWFAADEVSVVPDMILLSKGMSAGYYPIGALLLSRKLVEQCKHASPKLFHGFTYGGSPAGCAASLRCLEIIEGEGLLEKVRSDGEFLHSELTSALAKSPLIREIRARGLMVGIELEREPVDRDPSLAARIVRLTRDNGVIIRSTYGARSFNLAPPFICSRDDLSTIAWGIQKSLECVST